DLQDTENDTYSYYPFQENAVGRVTGWDAEDCSALIARTIFYNAIIQKLGEWKNTATVQTGCGLEFQKVPVLTSLLNMVTGGDEPTKWPTGESLFANLHITDDLEKSGFTVKNTFLLESQRVGFSNLTDVGRKYILFPRLLESISGEKAVNGGENQQNSNIIFTFAHGFYYLYEAGDILMDARGFPPFTTASRFYYMGSGLSSKGTYDVRSIANTEYGPSVIFVESCIVGRTDGFMPQNTLSQAYIHAGVNAMVAATRVTADPGYLEPGLILKGFGAKGFVNATLNLLLKDEYPDMHFGAVIAEDFILDMTYGDNTTGMALRNAKNMYLPKDANSTFMWTPPLTLTTGCKIINQMIWEELNKNNGEEGNFMDKKYHCLHEFVLYGDPAFNPYQPYNGD
ncbi:MAG: C25 family cysteine peptidase, partial [Candidatus Thermoplasmatota archaeon]|nr:C25 family cysteine peptidase [Candidatus Thermoplasmatota archaeon]